MQSPGLICERGHRQCSYGGVERVSREQFAVAGRAQISAATAVQPHMALMQLNLISSNHSPSYGNLPAIKLPVLLGCRAGMYAIESTRICIKTQLSFPVNNHWPPPYDFSWTRRSVSRVLTRSLNPSLPREKKSLFSLQIFCSLSIHLQHIQ